MRIFFSGVMIVLGYVSYMQGAEMKQLISQLEYLDEDFLDAVIRGDCDDIKFLLEHEENIRVNSCSRMGKVALVCAAATRNYGVVRLLCEHGANPDCAAHYEGGVMRTALIMAAINGGRFIAEYLIGQGANVLFKDSDGKDAMHYAAGNGHYRVVKLLHQAGALFDQKDTRGKTPLMYAALNGHCQIVKYILDNSSIDINAQDKDRNSALMEAVRHGHNDVVKLLVDCGADLTQRNKHKFTAYLYALLRSNNSHLLDLLGEKRYWDYVKRYDMQGMENLKNDIGVSFNARDREGKTALHHALIENNRAFFDQLMNRYAIDVNRADKDGITPLMLAVDQGNLYFVLTLLANGADVLARDHNDSDALSRATTYLEWYNAKSRIGVETGIFSKIVSLLTSKLPDENIILHPA